MSAVAVTAAASSVDGLAALPSDVFRIGVVFAGGWVNSGCMALVPICSCISLSDYALFTCYMFASVSSAAWARLAA